ncbi:DUF3825 domain-containing protein [Streptomyces scopuliridis]|uniref:DUF3825 domain-containing protein n=1 Tax=Streptomyces scopuliridis TaxID=452529 RepID=A0ACD4ZU39_9ACTN|nr:DUF3825 domain-containing protein [Streptomyces scopuliridis]WSC01699.1 DUF3825 domain-containing protein [Streptomyces scopuliridis]WSC04762.1 DUF3825 domain-containing protein [Streptomyces scopuliridis]
MSPLDLQQRLAALSSRETPVEDREAEDRKGFPQGNELSRFAYLGHIHSLEERRAGPKTQDVFDRLAQLAEPEDWAGPKPPHASDMGVLQHYLTWRFERAIQEERVIPDAESQLCVFNTGLATRRQESIYALFKPNFRPDRQPWCLEGWYLEGDRQLDSFPELPDPPAYSDEPCDYIFDRRLPLAMKPRDVVQMRIDKFPEELRHDRYGLELRLTAAVDRAMKMAARNYTTAVPMWYSVTEEVRLALPLSLTEPGEFDSALAIYRVRDRYRVGTVLSLTGAYYDARLLARPTAPWLNPN